MKRTREEIDATIEDLEKKNKALEATLLNYMKMINFDRRVFETQHEHQNKIIDGYNRKLAEQIVKNEIMEDIVKENERIINTKNKEINTNQRSGNQSTMSGNQIIIEKAMERGMNELKRFPNTRIEIMDGDALVLIVNPHIKNRNVVRL